MIELQQNRYLWVHFASLAFVPLLLDICLAGLASTGPALAFQGQFWAIALFAITPALAMQWLKPFYVFSLPPVALKPTVLSEDQRRCLQIFKSWQIKALAIAVAVFSVWLLVQLYEMTPQVSPLLSARAGLVSAAIAFFWASTFMQIAVSAARALLISPTALKRVAAVAEDAIDSDFLIAGIRVKKILLDIPAPVEMAPDTSSQPVDSSFFAEAESTPGSVGVEVAEVSTDEIPPLSAEAIDVSEAEIEVAEAEVAKAEAAEAEVAEAEVAKAEAAEAEVAEAEVAEAEVADTEVAEVAVAEVAVAEAEVAEAAELEIVIPETISPEEADNFPA